MSVLQLRVTRENITDEELSLALSAYIEQEGLSDQIVTRLEKAEGFSTGEKVLERYLKVIINNLRRDGQLVTKKAIELLNKWLPRQKNIISSPSLHQLEESRTLIESVFRKSLGLPIVVAPATEFRWRSMGITLTSLPELDKWITQSYVAGRLATVLDDSTSYPEMLRLAQKLPLTRQDELLVEIAQENCAKSVIGYGRRLADATEEVLLREHQKAISHVVQQYFSGDLRQTKSNVENLTPQEVETTLAIDRPGHLVNELRNRFKGTDPNRDWDRLAQTEVRFATNLGRLVQMQMEAGGKDPKYIQIYYSVQPTACEHCKRLYLTPEGQPKLFSLAEVLENVAETGGMNVGLKASEWTRPTACVHPHCHCYPLRYLPNYSMITPRGIETT